MCVAADNGIVEVADSIAEDFSFLDGWEDRYAHILALGRAMEGGDALAGGDRKDVNLIPGCASRVWMTCSTADDGRLTIRGASDSMLVSGLIAVLLSLYSHRTSSEILEFDAPAFFASMGLDRALTRQRANGLAAMHRRILQYARDADSAYRAREVSFTDG